MFCPQCGSTQPDDLNYCKACGAHLQAVRTALGSRSTDEGFDWNKTWVAEMLMSGEESVRRAAEIDRLRGITPEVRRRREIKAGIITASAGIGLTVVLAVIMEGIIASGAASGAAIVILSRLWIVGLIPILVGAALVINGLFVSKPPASVDDEQIPPAAGTLPGQQPEYLAPADTTNKLDRHEPFSVADETTRHLEKAGSDRT